ncbi:MAG: biotin transporter BioY [Phycisphaerales bacterium]
MAVERAIPMPRLGVSARVNPEVRALFEVGLFTLLTSFAAQIAVPLPPDGVPMTLHTLVVLLAALRLGPRLGAMSMVFYLAVGLAGAPVFSRGSAGLGVMLGQTGGYIVGFVLCQPVVHWIAVRRDGSVRGWLALVAAMTAAHAVVFAVGVPWLGVVRGFGAWRAIEGGLLPFVPGTIVKTVLAVLIGLWVAPLSVRRMW